MREKLCVVMPVYNEEGALEKVLSGWCAELDRLDVDWELHVRDDGSKDASLAVLQRFARGCPRVHVSTWANAGHGPTVLALYREAVASGADWIFQTDSDDELPPGRLAELWNRRRDFDLVAGIRSGRVQSCARRIVSAVSRALVRVLFGHSIRDVNVPYRLMRAAAFAPVLDDVPSDAFAPNVVLAGLAARHRLRVCDVPVPHRVRATGVVSLNWRRLLRGAVLSFLQTVRVGLAGGRSAVFALAVAGLAWGALYALWPQGAQARVFCEHGASFFGDFTRMAAVAASGPHAAGVSSFDIPYPALSYVLARPFPGSAAGGFAFALLGVGLLLLALQALLRSLPRRAVHGLVAAVAAGLTSSMLYAFEWGNTVLYAGACVVLWAAWRDAAEGWKRSCAAVALAAASVLKVAPAVFVLDYVARRERDWKGLGTFVAAGLALFLAPYLLWGGGEALVAWFGNAAGNASHYVHKGAWGAVPVGRLVRVLLGMDVSAPWPGIGWERLADIALGLSCLAAGAVARQAYGRVMGLTAALLLVPGNMHFYTGVYLLPAFILWTVRPGRAGWLAGCEGACWFLVFMPIQIPLGAGCLNHPLANAAFLALAGASVWKTAKALWYTDAA